MYSGNGKIETARKDVISIFPSLTNSSVEEIKMAKFNLPCSIPDCNSKQLARGFCTKHYQRWWTYGDTDRGRLTDEQKFWLKVDKNGPVHPRIGTACWIWTGSTGVGGYGRFRVGRRTRPAHCFSFFLAHGTWPEPYGLHHCDNRPCVRPDHLYAGTLQDNMDDKVVRHRQYRKLSPHDINPIRRLIRSGVSYSEIGRRYAVAGGTIFAIDRGISWKHIEFEDDLNAEDLDFKVKVTIDEE